MSVEIVTKSVVSVSEMARMVGLSRARFYQLIRRGTFPASDQDSLTNRPCYFEENQRKILEARRRNCGVDGKPILFYCRRMDLGQKRVKPGPVREKLKTSVKKYADLIDGLAAVNLSVTIAQLDPILKELFPAGIEQIDPGEVIRAVFLRIRSQNSSGSA